MLANEQETGHSILYKSNYAKLSLSLLKQYLMKNKQMSVYTVPQEGQQSR